MIHVNSHSSFYEIKEDLKGRHKEIFEVFKIGKRAMTDRQVKETLGLDDMNTVRPRITELIKKGYLTESTNTKCPVTGKTVRVCRKYFQESKQLEMRL